MSIQQTKRQSELEKRLQILRRQVYGKPASQNTNKSTGSANTLIHRYTDTPIHQPDDLAYLRQDLWKIAIFSSIAIGGQFLLFFLLNNHILKLNFF